MRTYAIGDIHGHLDKLEAAHRRIEADRARVGDPSSPVVHIGDLVDRGPDSRGVVEFLLRGHRAGANWVTLMGNHDRMFVEFMRDPDSHDPGLRIDLHWIDPRLGGRETLASYGVANAAERMLPDLHEEALDRVPSAHVQFLSGLPTDWQNDDAFFAHAGIRPGVALNAQSVDDLLWIRREFLDDPRDHGRLVVHGHTPIEAPVHYGNRLNIDSGAAFGRGLTAVVIENGRVWVIEDEGRRELAPQR